MPKVMPPAPMRVDLWVKQGKTDHMATLEDTDVLLKLTEMKDKSPYTFSVSTIQILDLVEADTAVEVRWSSNTQVDTVEAESIRFRDLEIEGRGSARGGRPSRSRGGRSSGAPKPVVVAPATRKAKKSKNPKKASSEATKPKSLQKKVPKRKRNEDGLPDTKRKRNEDGLPDTREPIEISANSSVATTEGRDELNENSLQKSAIETSKGSAAVAPSDENVANTENDKDSSNIDSRQQMPMPLDQKNVFDLDNEEFDSSDDEAITYRMKIKKERDAAISSNDVTAPDTPSTFRNQLSGLISLKKSRLDLSQEKEANKLAGEPSSQEDQSGNQKKRRKSDNESATASNNSERKLVSKKKKRRTGSSGGSSSDDDSSFSAPTEASSTTSWRKRRHRYPNGYDSDDDDDDDDDVLAVDGQTNTTNWTKMKRLFKTNFV